MLLLLMGDGVNIGVPSAENTQQPPVSIGEGSSSALSDVCSCWIDGRTLWPTTFVSMTNNTQKKVIY